MKKYIIVFGVLIALVFFSCTNDIQNKSNEDLSMEIELAMQHYVDAIKSLNVDSVVDCWTRDGRFISDKRDIQGKENLKEWLSPVYEDLYIFELKATTTTLEVTDNLAVHLSEYHEVLSKGDGPRNTISGEQLFIWEKEDGKWKISMGYAIPSFEDTIH